jgi:Domain of unknown function (DUF4258)
MSDLPRDLIERIREAFRLGKYTLRVHGFERMIQRDIHPTSIRNAVIEGEAIEYDKAGTKGADESVLFNGFSNQQAPIHVKVAERITSKGYTHFVVTVYEPDPFVWTDNYRKRRQS